MFEMSNACRMIPVTGALGLGARALAMSLDDATLILTLADEPQLILAAGESPPKLDPLDVAAARLVDAWDLAGSLNAASEARQ